MQHKKNSIFERAIKKLLPLLQDTTCHRHFSENYLSLPKNMFSLSLDGTYPLDFRLKTALSFP